MKQLTEAEGRRCARALGWKRFKKVVAEGGKPVMVWVSPQRREGEYNCFAGELKYKGAEYWFPRLWDEWEKLSDEGNNGGGVCLKLIRNGINGGYAAESDLKSSQFDIHPCLALCAAIESLEGK